jgi:hypothetical protein
MQKVVVHLALGQAQCSTTDISATLAGRPAGRPTSRQAGQQAGAYRVM